MDEQTETELNKAVIRRFVEEVTTIYDASQFIIDEGLGLRRLGKIQLHKHASVRPLRL